MPDSFSWACSDTSILGTALQFELETKLCIRDALYRLARSAMRRKGSGGRGGGEESGNTQVSEDGDAASDGLESSINSDPCSSSRVSRYCTSSCKLHYCFLFAQDFCIWTKGSGLICTVKSCMEFCLTTTFAVKSGVLDWKRLVTYGWGVIVQDEHEHGGNPNQFN